MMTTQILCMNVKSYCISVDSLRGICYKIFIIG